MRGRIPEYQEKAIQEHIADLRSTINWHYEQAKILERKIKEQTDFLKTNEEKDIER